MTHYTAHCSNGYFSYDRIVYVSKRLDSMPAAQAGIIERKNGVQLVSYETIVAEIENGWLHVYGTFSNTTRRHIGAFMKEFAPGYTYQDAKRCYEKDIELNIHTGETRRAFIGTEQTIGIRAAV